MSHRSVLPSRPHGAARSFLTAFIGVIAVAFFTPSPAWPIALDEKADAQDLKKLQGTWVVAEAERDGAALDRIKGNKLIVKENQFTVVPIGGAKRRPDARCR